MKNILIILISIGSSFNILNAQKITVQFNATPTTTTITKASLKYNKDIAFSLTLDDATSDAYDCVLPLFKGGTVSGNGQSYQGLNYTDGCGNNLPFKAGIGWNSANLSEIDVHTGNVPGQLTWQQLDSLYNAGWDVFNHSYTHRSALNGAMTQADYVYQIEQNRVNVANKTQKHITMPFFIVPSGDTVYNSIAYQQGHQLVFNQPGNTIGTSGGLDVTNNVNYSNKIIYRPLVEESITLNPGLLDVAVGKTTGGAKIWYNEFTHRTDNFSPTAAFGFKDFDAHFERAANLWGKNGSDKMWMAPLQEVYEYLMMRQNASFTTSTNGSNLDIIFNLSTIPTWLRRKSLTLVVNSAVDFSNVVLPAGVKATFKGSGSQKLINLDFTDFKTTAINDISITPSVLKIYPNPVSDYLTAELPNGDNAQYQAIIYNVAGDVILTEQGIGQNVKINTTMMPKGYYFLSVRQGDVFYKGSFIK